MHSACELAEDVQTRFHDVVYFPPPNSQLVLPITLDIVTALQDTPPTVSIAFWSTASSLNGEELKLKGKHRNPKQAPLEFFDKGSMVVIYQNGVVRPKIRCDRMWDAAKDLSFRLKGASGRRLSKRQDTTS